MRHLLKMNLLVVFVLLLAACGGGAPAATEEPAAATEAPADTGSDEEPAANMSGVENPDEYGEQYDADPALLTKAVGTSEGVSDIALAAFYRAGLPVDQDMTDLAMKCYTDKICETGTGGPLTVALADGFGENFWRQMTHMEFILQALTYPEIGKITYDTSMK